MTTKPITPANIFLAIMSEARAKQNITIEDLAERMGVHAHALERWERGGKTPRLQIAIRIASELGYRLELVRAA